MKPCAVESGSSSQYKATPIDHHALVYCMNLKNITLPRLVRRLQFTTSLGPQKQRWLGLLGLRVLVSTSAEVQRGSSQPQRSLIQRQLIDQNRSPHTESG